MIRHAGRVFLLAALLLSVACGDDDSDEADTTDDATESAGDESDTTDGTTEPGGEGDGDGSTTPTVDVSGLEGFCRDALGARNMANEAGALLSSDPDGAADGLGATRDTMAGITPPDQLAEDWTTVTDAIGALADSMAEGADEPPPGLEEADAATDRIDAYLTDECGVNLETLR